MKSRMDESLALAKENRLVRNRRTALFAVLAAAVVLCVSWALHQPGIAASNATPPAGLNITNSVTQASFSTQQGSEWVAAQEFQAADATRATLSFEKVSATELAANSNTAYVELPKGLDVSGQLNKTFQLKAADDADAYGTLSFTTDSANNSYAVLAIDAQQTEGADEAAQLANAFLFSFNWDTNVIAADGATHTIEVGKAKTQVSIAAPEQDETAEATTATTHSTQSDEGQVAAVSEQDSSDDAGVSTQADGTGVDMGDYITSVSFQKKNGVIWEESDTFTTADQVRATMNFEKVYTSTLKANNNTIYIDLPAYIDCSKFTGTYDTYDGGRHSGTYTYQKNADGTYRIVLVLDEDYVTDVGDVIGGNLQFNFNWTKDAVTDEGNKKIEIGNWSGEVKVIEDKSDNDNNSSANYSISKSAGSLYYSEDGKTAYIDYTVTLTVKNAMAAPINMKDVLTGDGFTYDSTINVTGGDVKVNFGNTEGQGTATQIQLWPSSGSTVQPGTYTITYRVKSLGDVSDSNTKLPDTVGNKVTVPEDGKDSISSETWTKTTTGTINKQGQLVSGSDATYIDYTVYLNAGDIVKNLKTPANFTDTLPDTLELQGDVTVKQYDVTGKEVSSTTATVNGQNISYTTPTGQYYYIITYRAKVKDSDKLPIGDTVIKNTGTSEGGINGSSDSEITIPNHVLHKKFESQQVGQDENGTWTNTMKWSSTIDVTGSLQGYTYEDWADLTYIDGAWYSVVSMSDEQRSAIVVKDANGNVVDSSKYTISKCTHTSQVWNTTSNAHEDVDHGLFKIEFSADVTGPVTIEYETTADLTKFKVNAYISFTNWGQLSKDGHVDKDSAQSTTILYTHGNPNIIKKYGSNDGETNDKAGITLEPGQTSIPWSIRINDDGSLYSDLTITDVIAENMTYLPDTFKVTRNGWDDITSAVTVNYDSTTHKLTVNVPKSAYAKDANQGTNNKFVISYRTQLPDSFFEGSDTNQSFSNKATLDVDGSTTDSSFTQDVTRQVVGKSGSYDKDQKVLAYDVVVNPDGSTLNSGNTLTVSDTLDAGAIKDYVTLKSLQVFTALKTTDESGKTKVEPGKFVQELAESDSNAEFTYTWDNDAKTFTTYLPDSMAYVIVAKYDVGVDVTQAVKMKNTVKIAGNDSWKKEDNSTSVDQNTSGETHTEKDKLTLTKHDTASYNTLLSGASFQLDAYKNGAWSTFGSVTTNEKGVGTIEDIEYGVLYKLGETQAPDGYIIDDGPTYFIVVRESNQATAKDNLPDSITGDSNYSKDAVAVYTVKDNPKNSDGTEDKKYFANVQIDRYNAVDKDKVEPGQLRVTKNWVDASGNAMTDASNMPEITATLTKHVANSGHTITLQAANQTDKVFASGIYDGAYIYTSGWGTDWSESGLSWEQAGTVSDTDNTPVYKIGPITSDLTINNEKTYWNCGTFLRQEGGTAPSGTTDTVIGTVTLNADNDWTYLFSNLERGDGITYTLTEQTVEGYNATYTINGTDLQPGATFTPGDKGDKVTITNTANPEYELPATGGAGIGLFLIGGAALALAATYGLSVRRRGKGGMS